MDIKTITEITVAIAAVFIAWRTYIFTKQQDKRNRDPELFFVLTNSEISMENGWPQGYSVMAVNNSMSNSIVLRNHRRSWMIADNYSIDKYIEANNLVNPLGKTKFAADVLVGPGEAKVICTFEKELWKILKDSSSKQINLFIKDIVTGDDHTVGIHYIQSKKNTNRGYLEIKHTRN